MSEPGDIDRRIQFTVENTEVVRSPQQSLATFGATQLPYFLVTEPVYKELLRREERETVLRKGRVSAERPRLVTPFYLMNLFQGFEHGAEYSEHIRNRFGTRAQGLLYQYKNELLETRVLSSPLEAVLANLKERLDRERDSLAAIIRGVDEMWDVSLMKFIFDFTEASLSDNVMELAGRGLLEMDSAGVPRDARFRIEELFQQVRKGEIDPSELKLELDHWGLFPEYEERFLQLFRR